jgi:PrtD family type I secretion system ABC transporter
MTDYHRYLVDKTKAVRSNRRPILGTALQSCRWACISVVAFTAIINVLALSGSLFMMEVYNRVLPSRSIPTLVVLSALVLFLLAIQGSLEVVRGRLLVRMGNLLYENFCGRVYAALILSPVKAGSAEINLRPVKDLDTLRSFLSSQGPAALFDLPWIIFYLAILFAFHVYLGLVALFGGVLVVSLTLLTELLTRRSLYAAAQACMERDNLSDVTRRNAETIFVLGMQGWMAKRWRLSGECALRHSQQASDVALGFGSLARMLRLMIQSAVLAIGALLVIQQEATGGLIIASAVLAARALAPIDTAIGHWRGFILARQSWRRLSAVLSAFAETPAPLQLPAPKARLDVENVTVAPPGSPIPVLQNVSFSLQQGQAVCIIGASASGKSSLARTLIGIWPAIGGTIRLDAAAVEQWSSEALGRHIGYMPQQVELFAGSIAENVARFDPEASAEDVIKAARAAGIHDLILSLPAGYETQVGPGARALSAGQQQRIALARALYRDPFLIVLDEPNSSLDSQGEAALSKAILEIRNRGGIVVVISHRPSALAAVDHILLLVSGRVEKFGPKNEVLAPQRRIAVSARRIEALDDAAY